MGTSATYIITSFNPEQSGLARQHSPLSIHIVIQPAAALSRYTWYLYLTPPLRSSRQGIGCQPFLQMCKPSQMVGINFVFASKQRDKNHFKWSAGIVITSNAHFAKGDAVTMVVEGMAVEVEEEEEQGHSARLLSLMVLMQY
ncbi:unnamed protein product [Arctogadus glacialis]